MKIKFSSIISQGSGSIGSSTFARNRYGQYAREKVMPVDPNSNLQAAVRAYFSSLCAGWNVLTAAQRLAWEVYGQNTTATDSMGNSIVLPGRQWYIGNNTLRLQAGLSVIAAGPTSYGLPIMTKPTPTVAPGTSASLVFTNTDAWATAAGGALMFFVSKPKAPTINFCKGPYRYAGKITGAVTPPTSPATIALPYTFTAGQRVYWRAVAVTADGRVSADNWGDLFCA